MRGRLVKATAMFMAILMMVTSVPLNVLAQEAGSSLPLESELQGRDTETQDGKEDEEQEEVPTNGSEDEVGSEDSEEEGEQEEIDDSDGKDEQEETEEPEEKDEQEEQEESENGVDDESTEEAESDDTVSQNSISENSIDKLLLENEKSALAEGDISRIQWMNTLIETFGLSVDASNYPDNYYSDLDSSSEQYRNVMIATEFGLVDVEAGDAIELDEAATREYAAFSLNQLVGYVNESEYSFGDVDEAKYPDADQVALDQGWLSTIDGKFLPDQAITSDEKQNMITKGSAIIGSTDIDSSHNKYQFRENVIILDASKVRLTGENQLTITENDTNFGIGDIIGLVADEIPYAWKVKDIAESEDNRVVTTEHVDVDDAFLEYDIQTSLDIDLSQIAPASQNADMVYIVGGTESNNYEDGEEYYTLSALGNQEISAVRIDSYVDSYENSGEEGEVAGDERQANASGYNDEYNLTDASKIKLSATISNVKADYKGGKTPFFKVDGRVSISFSASIDMIKASGLPNSFVIMYMPVGYVAYESVSVKISLQGEMTLNYVADFSAGVQYENGGIRVISSFSKKEFTIQQDLQCSVALVAEAGFDIHVLGGRVYAEIGGKAELHKILYSPGSVPQRCSHIKAWMFADLGYSVWLDKSLGGKSFGKKLVIFDFYNSPVRVEYHYEDGVPVDKCSLGGFTDEATGKRVGKYTTPANSRYGYNGASKGNDVSGNPYTIFTYTLNSNNQATITGFRGNTSSIKIPDTLDGYEVIAIGESAFKGNTTLRYVGMTNNITKIDYRAFMNCSALREIQLSYNLTYLGGGAFRNCISLQSILIPKSLNNISSYQDYSNMAYIGAFTGCKSLKEVSFEEGITVIPYGLFRYCETIEKIEIPDSVTLIEDYAFDRCRALKEVRLSESLTEIRRSAFAVTAIEEIEIPDNTTKIGERAFENCTNLKKIKLSKQLASLGVGVFRYCVSLQAILIPKSLKECQNETFRGCTSLNDISFEEGITYIPYKLFADCDVIERIEIPDSVTVVGQYAFDDCTALKEIVLSSSITEIQNFAFKGTAISEIEIPDSTIKIGDRAFEDCEKLSKVKLSQKLTSIGVGAFRNCTSLQSIEIPKALKKCYISQDNSSLAYYGTFTGCINLKEISFEEGTTVIPAKVFAYCNGIEEITIPNTITQVGESAFRNCTSLKKVDFPGSIVSIEDYAFSGCKSLGNFELQSGVKEIKSNTFSNCISLQEAYIPDTVTAMGGSTFYGCTNLKKAHIPNIRQNLTAYTFYNCQKLAEVNLPDTLEAVREYAFYNCDSLKEIKLPEKVSCIEGYAFYDCDTLETVTMPTALTELGKFAFAECDSLKNVTIGEGITTIPQKAFYNCIALEEVVVPYKVTSIGQYAFGNDPKLAKITIPRSVTSIDETAFSYKNVMSIYGVPGTYAQTYADTYGYQFVSNEVKAESVEIVPAEPVVNSGYTVQLQLKVVPSDFTDAVSWKSADTSIATVDRTGLVKGVAKGSTTIKVIVGSVSKTCKLTVNQPVTSVSLSASSKTMSAGEEAVLKATVYPAGATNKEVTWSSSADEIVSVDQTGAIRALRKGIANVTATAQDGSGRSATCKVTVTNNLYIVDSEAGFESSHPYPDNCQDIWEYTDENAAKIAITFSDDTSVEDGFDYLYIYDVNKKQVGKYTGTALAGKTITVTGTKVQVKLVSDDAGSEYGFRIVKVQSKGKDVALKSISLSKNSVSMKCGETEQLEVLYTPENTTVDKNVIWTSSDSQIATVENGLVTAQSRGEATITASVGGKKASCLVEVTTTLSGIELVSYKTKLKVGETTRVSVKSLTNGYLPIDELNYENETPECLSVENHLESGYLIVNGVAAGEGKIIVTAGEFMKEAVFSIIQPKLKFYDDETQIIGEKEQAYGDPVVFIESPEKDGFVFGGWYTAPEGKGELLTEDSIYTDQESAFAYWLTESDSIWVSPLGDYNYTGKAIKPIVRVYDGNRLLCEKVDYTLSYANNIMANTKYHDALLAGEDMDSVITAYGKKMPYVKIIGKGNYKESQIVYFSIMPKDISDFDIEINESQLVKPSNGKKQSLVPSIKWGKISLKNKKDFTVSYPDETEAGAYQAAGQYTIHVEGKGNYCGSRDVLMNLTGKGKVMMSKISVKRIAKQNWTGELVTPSIYAAYAGQALEEGIDYRLSYSNNQEIGTASVCIIGKGRFAGTKTTTFQIIGTPISKAEISGITEQTYFAAERPQESLTVSYHGKILQEGTDYTVSYSNHIKAGNAKVTITGIHAFCGKVTKTFKIKPYPMTGEEISIGHMDEISAVYCKGGAKPALTIRFKGEELQEGIDYRLTYKNNGKPMEANAEKAPMIVITGLKNFGGKQTVAFAITESPMNGKAVVNAEDVLFANKKNKWKAKVTVKDIDGKTMTAGKDYDKNLLYVYAADAIMVDGSMRTEGESVLPDDIPVVGTQIRVTVTGMNNYQTGDMVSTIYRIVGKNLSKAKFTVATQIYTGKDITLSEKDFVKAAIGKEQLRYGVDYEIVEGSYIQNIKKGKASLLIHGIGEYGGTKKVTFNILSKNIY